MIQKPMYEFEKTKEMEKRIFEAKMTGNNHALDKQLAKRLITSMLQYFEEEAIQDSLQLSFAKRHYYAVVKHRMIDLKEYMNDFKLCL